MSITIRLAQRRDALEIALLSKRTIEFGLPWSWDPARVAKAISNQSTNVVIARIADVLSGFGIMEYTDTKAHLSLLAIDEQNRRQGLGSQILKWLEDVARMAGITEFRVEARADNLAALAFYRKHGYREVATELGMYYGVEDGVRLAKSFTSMVADAQPLMAFKVPRLGRE
jgi:[ribosomal protein S18]-alanine N-acetyltransferase